MKKNGKYQSPVRKVLSNVIDVKKNESFNFHFSKFLIAFVVTKQNSLVHVLAQTNKPTKKKYRHESFRIFIKICKIKNYKLTNKKTTTTTTKNTLTNNQKSDDNI